ncbi:YqgE/AlgH family protein [Nocardioides sp. GY 10127]|uniref:YqgE/AlgH family protein n=1 Tax=Nocardioides sp. GY 10127 TaxID=2569762 RepID=UPI0010A7837D|nr:YqgE/AlgH family protein [Nocardioides sp. GY 10127]TIC81595.1 YqgE/AlgH family protein [Nocardioides sp. GY 10127]
MAEVSTPAAGMLLVATPALEDPHFADTVVLVIDADDEGALGVVLNRPTSVPVGEVLETWAGVVAEPDVLFAGGPVGRDGALALGVLPPAPDGAPGEPGERVTAAPVGFRAVWGDVGLLDLDTPVELLAEGLAGIRIFAGYSGWGPGQLEAEIEEGSWYVVPGEAADVFRPSTDTLWREVLRRQPGDLAWHSTRPSEPGLN